MISADQATFEEIIGSVDELSKRAGTTSERAFAAWYAINFLDVDEDDALEAASIDGGEDQGIDFLLSDDANERVVLLQAHLGNSHSNATPKKKFDALEAAIPTLDSPDTFRKAGRHDLANLVEETNADLEKGYEAIAGIVSLGSRSESIDRLIIPHNEGQRFRPFRLFYEPFESIRNMYHALKVSEEGGVAEDQIRFAGDRYFEETGEFGRAYVGSLLAKDLATLYEKHRERLFERNVRLYLGTRKGSINEQIVGTAKDAPGRFWALINGITIVADTISRTPEKAFRITRFSVVNGCQTTVSLWKANASSDARVLTRLVAAKQAVVSDIVRYNNTQNAVKIWTVRAVDQVQKKLSEGFQSIGASYAPKPSAGGRRASRSPTIELDRLAQYIAASNGLVIEAVREKSELFDRHYQSIFPHDIHIESAYQAWLIGSLADQLRQGRLLALKSSGSASELLPFLGVAGTYWITYCAEKLVRGFNKMPVHLRLTAMVRPQFQNSLHKYVEEALDIFFDLASDTYDAGEYGSPRQAMRSVKFLSKIAQKLENRVASMKAKKKKLPDLEATIKSTR